MRMPEEVAAMLRLRDLGWGTRRIAAALGCNRETVQRYLAVGGWAPYRTPERPGGLEGAFQHFGGLPGEVRLDNAKALVEHHDPATLEVRFNARLHAFARYWDVRAVASAPYQARTKGKDERGVGYVKRNAIAGRRFASWSALEAHLAQWCRDVADVRVHGTTGEPPITRFARDEAAALKPLGGRAPFGQLRDLVR